MSDQVEIQIDADSISQGHDVTNNKDSGLYEEDVQLIRELREAKSIFSKDLDDRKEKQEDEPKEIKGTIHRVPDIMLRSDAVKTKFFTPKRLPIGPMHGANDSTLLKKELKLKLAEHFISESGNEEYSLLKTMKTRFENDIHKYFNKNDIPSYSNKNAELLRLVFLDGCAMLGFIHSHVHGRLNEFGITDDEAALIKQDLFMLDNQIPFEVLEVLMGEAKELEKNNELKDDFLTFVCHMSNTTFPRDSLPHVKCHFSRYIYNKKKDQKPVHILDLFREVILFECNHDHFENMLTVGRDIFCVSFCCIPILLFYCMMSCFSKSHLPQKCNSKISFRNVQELKTSGIRFLPSDSLKGISFHPLLCITAQLKLPTLVVDDSTEMKLLNLVAYEMCLHKSYHQNRDPWVTSYVKLLDLLIDNEHDVKDLRAVDILRNCLSTDTQVSSMINGIGSICFAPSKDTYENVKIKIQKHYRRRCAIWTAQVCHAHFSSPWTILGLFAATTVLLLTAIQTWFAVYKV